MESTPAVLRDLHIRNLAVLEEASIELGSGFNVLSGETGAGKSIVVDSLALLSGVRASSELIRTGADSLTVTGFFDPDRACRKLLQAAGIELEADVQPEDGVESEDSELVIRREVSRSGRNRVFVNDRPVTLKLLGEIAPYLIRIHGQREELGLVAPELQRTWLDLCGKSEAEKLLRRVAAAYANYRTAAERLERLSGDDRSRHERIDFLRFQLAELDEAELELGEEDDLRREREVLRHSEAIRQALLTASDQLFDREGAAYDQINRSRQALQDVEAWEPEAAGWVKELDELAIRLSELETGVRHRLDAVEADPRRLDAIEERLVTLERLFRKHGATSAETLERRAALAAELAELEGDESTLAEVEEQVQQALASYREAAAALSEGRRKWAEQLARRVRKELRDMALEKARFAVRLDRRRRAESALQVAGEGVEFGVHGYDHVVFVFSPNPGEELGPLDKVASGGELSRLYLAVQLATRSGAKTAGPVTLVFDEVDSGIGGGEAAKVGGKLKRLARGGQILAVTHLPQVASCADIHFKVSKQVRKGRTHTRLQQLSEDQRVDEVARMLAGSEVTDLSRSHARELIVGAGG
ncbi:MAG: DNA repair protein RecN [Acidobacteriota bacterium]